jgi:hypothetical protein
VHAVKDRNCEGFFADQGDVSAILVAQRPRVAPDPVVIREAADVALGRERNALVVEEGRSNTPATRRRRLEQITNQQDKNFPL